MIKYLFIAFVLFYLSSFILAQDYKSSLILEVGGLTANKDYYLSSNNKKEFIGGYSLSYSGIFILNSNYMLELRPGFTLYSVRDARFYPNLQTGIFVRRTLIDSTFIVFGTNFAFNLESSPSTSATPKAFSYSLGSAISTYLSSDISILFSIYKTLFENFGYGNELINDHWTGYNIFVDWFFKIGIEYRL